MKSSSSQACWNVLVVKDDLGAYVWLPACTDPDAGNAKRCLLNWIPGFRGLYWLASDRHPHFISHFMQDITEQHLVKHSVSTANYPWENRTVDGQWLKVLRSLNTSALRIGIRSVHLPIQYWLRTIDDQLVTIQMTRKALMWNRKYIAEPDGIFQGIRPKRFLSRPTFVKFSRTAKPSLKNVLQS